jgi:hypothetical protein
MTGMDCEIILAGVIAGAVFAELQHCNCSSSLTRPICALVLS